LKTKDYPQIYTDFQAEHSSGKQEINNLALRIRKKNGRAQSELCTLFAPTNLVIAMRSLLAAARA